MRARTRIGCECGWYSPWAPVVPTGTRMGYLLADWRNEVARVVHLVVSHWLGGTS